jgi:AcrR family transcriptional regulator
MPKTRPAPHSVPKRARYNRDDVVRVAGVLAERGIDHLTMSAVARELNVTPMALYQHVADKAHLLDLVRDSLMRNVDVPPKSTGSWDVRLRQLHLDITAAMSRCRGLESATSNRLSEESARLLDGYLQILLDGGFDVVTAVQAYTGLFHMAMGAQDPLFADVPTPAAISPEGENLPALAAAAPVASELGSRELEIAAFDIYLDGLRRLHRRLSRSP